MTDQLDNATLPPAAPPEPDWKPSWERPEAQCFLNRHLGAILIGLIAFVVLVALGCVPFRAGNATRALAQAISAVAQADSLHLTVRDPAAGRGVSMQAWATSDGFWRIEGLSGRRLRTLWLRSREWEVVYDARQHTEVITPMPASWLTDQDFTTVGGPVTAKLAVLLQAAQEMELREWRARSLLRGSWNVAEAEGNATAPMSAEGMPYSEGDPVKLRLETDETTGLPRTLTLSKRRGRKWVQVSLATFAWDRDLPAAAYKFKPPKGTKVVADVWWGDYANRTLATGSTHDWSVVLHAVNTNVGGDLFLTLSRRAVDQGRMEPDQDVQMKVQATDDAGGDYQQTNCYQSVPGLWGGYFRVILRRDREEPPASTVDLVVRPYADGQTANESVTFVRVSLPLPVTQDDRSD